MNMTNLSCDHPPNDLALELGFEFVDLPSTSPSPSSASPTSFIDVSPVDDIGGGDNERGDVDSSALGPLDGINASDLDNSGSGPVSDGDDYDDDEWNYVSPQPSEDSKREYLLAQIRQKDAIIESLLKQLHNPYIATPLSIAAYRMASSPSDTAGSRNVIQWLERLQSSLPAQGENGKRVHSLDESIQSLLNGSKSWRSAADDDSEGEGDTIGGTVAPDAETETIDDDWRDVGGLSGPSVQGDGRPGSTGPVDNSMKDQPRGTENTLGDSVVSAETIRQQADMLPDDAVPLGLIANMSLRDRVEKGKVKKKGRGKPPHGIATAMNSVVDELEQEENADDTLGVASETYFVAGPASDLDVRKMLIERHSLPEILAHGLVTEEEVEKLFQIFYEKLNPFLSLLDPVLHTPASTFARCPFLFTVICAISSRYYREKSEIYAIAMHFAKHSAATALIDGWKSVELCQAYILMAVYAVPAKRWEEDRSWLYTGLAIRIATDLNLHQAPTTKPTDEIKEREILNRTRVWMICYNLDRSTATQFGKPSTIKEDYGFLWHSILRNSKLWYQKSQYNHPYDVHLCAHSALLRIVAKFHEEVYSDQESPMGLNENLNFRAVTLSHDQKLEEYHVEWKRRFEEESDPNDEGCEFRCCLLPFYVNYSRLVMFSFGFQHAFKRGLRSGEDISVFFEKCMDSAKKVIECVVDTLAPSTYFRYAPDAHFVFASFASAFLLKLMRPELSHLLSREQAEAILNLIGRLIRVLASSDVSIDDRHTPKLYARFLAGLLAKHRPEGSSSGRLHPTHPPDGHGLDTAEDYGDFGRGNGMGGDSNFNNGNTGNHGQPSQSMSFQVNTMSDGVDLYGSTMDFDNEHKGANGMAPINGAGNPSSGVMSGQTSLVSTPIYEPEATYAVGTAGPLELGIPQLGMSGLDMALSGFHNTSEGEVLATMQALKNPAWWNDMLMPGFSWPQDSPQMVNGHMHGHVHNGYPMAAHV